MITKRRMRSPSLLALLVWGCLILTRAPAFADAKDEARILFEAGVTASRADRWLEASEYFQRSLSLSEKPSTWFNLAVAEVKLGHGPEALRALSAFEQMANRTDHAEMLERAVTLRAQAQELMRQQPSAVPLPAPAVPEEPPPAAPRPAAPVQELSVEVSPVPRAQAETYSPSRRGPFLMLGAGLAAAAGTVGAVLWWRDRVHANERCEADPARCTNAGQLEREQRTAGGVSLALGLVSAGLITGGATWLVRENRRVQHGHVRLNLGSRAAEVRLGLAF